jgi:hypothetical protein
LTLSSCRDVLEVHMPVSRSIEVNASLQSMANAWSYFLEWILVDGRRLLCSELACVEPMKQGIVRFEAIDDAHTLVVFELPSVQGDAAAPSEEELAGRLWQDLALFKEYIETARMNGRERKRRTDPRQRHAAHGAPAAEHPPASGRY